MSRRRRFLQSLATLPTPLLDRLEAAMVAEGAGAGLLEEAALDGIQIAARLYAAAHPDPNAPRRRVLRRDDGCIFEVDEGGYRGRGPDYGAPVIIGL